jgi:hypothetical protein
VYHDRAEPEREELRQVIVASVRTDARRRETEVMTRTIAEALRDEGKEEGRREGELRSQRQTLVRQLRLRYQKVPKAVERTVMATEDLGQLQTWLDRIITASTLDEIGIPADS